MRTRASRVFLPRHFDDDLGYSFSSALRGVSDAGEVILDFSQVEFAYPTGTLVIGSSIRRFVASRKQRKLVTMLAGKNSYKASHAYLEHVGFFDFIGLPDARKIGDARGSDTYVPIKRYAKTELCKTDSDMHDAILIRAQDLANVLIGLRPEDAAYRAVSYSLKEVIRNVFEHSGAEECFVTAQRWRTGEVELAVIDEGMGIRTSLGKTVECITDLDAVKKAIQPGVSRTMGMDFGQNQHQNSGFGLYVLSEFGRCFGQFSLSSGNAMLRISTSAGYELETSINGTLVGLRMESPPLSFDGVLEDIVSEGERDANASGLSARASRNSREINIKR